MQVSPLLSLPHYVQPQTSSWGGDRGGAKLGKSLCVSVKSDLEKKL